MDITAGDRIILQLSTFEDRFLGVVADVREDGRMLVFATMPPAALARIKVDTVASVKYAFDGRLLGFSTRVLNAIDAEDTLIELECPGTVFDAEDRMEPRCSCCYPAIVVENGRAAQGVVEDMSASCARVRYIGDGLSDFPEVLERPVTLTFHPFEMDEMGYSVGCAVAKAFMKNGERYVVLRFNDDEKDARKRISRFIEAQVCCALPIM